MPLCCFLSGLGRPSFIILAVGEGHSTLSVLLTHVYVELQSLLGSLFLRKSVTNFSLIEIATQLILVHAGGSVLSSALLGVGGVNARFVFEGVSVLTLCVAVSTLARRCQVSG